MAIVATLYNRSASSPSARQAARISRTKRPTSSGVRGLGSVRRTEICRQPKLPKCRRKCEIASTSRSVMAPPPLVRLSGLAVASVRPGAHERSSRQGKYETSLVDEKNHVDDLVAWTGRAPEPSQDRPPGGVLEVEEGSLQRRDASRGQDGHHEGPRVAGRDGRPMMHAQFLGLMVDPGDTPSAGFV